MIREALCAAAASEPLTEPVVKGLIVDIFPCAFSPPFHLFSPSSFQALYLDSNEVSVNFITKSINTSGSVAVKRNKKKNLLVFKEFDLSLNQHIITFISTSDSQRKLKNVLITD